MKANLNILKLNAFSLILIGCCGAFAQEPRVGVDQLGWLKGCWGSDRNGREISEHWMKPAGRTMLGMSRTVGKGKTIEFEFIQIREEENGDILFVAKPSAQAEAAFKLVRSGRHEVVFENLKHDFPQRIIYRLESDGSLFARIEGESGGKQRSINYQMKRAPCE